MIGLGPRENNNLWRRRPACTMQPRPAAPQIPKLFFPRSLAAAFPAPVSGRTHDAYFVFSFLRSVGKAGSARRRIGDSTSDAEALMLPVPFGQRKSNRLRIMR